MSHHLVASAVEFNISRGWWQSLLPFFYPNLQELCEKQELILTEEKLGCHLLQEDFPDLIPTNLNWVRGWYTFS